MVPGLDEEAGPGCERLPMRTPLGAVSVLLPLGEVEKMLVEEAEFPDGGEDGGGGSVMESKDDLQCGRAQQEASEGGIQQRAAAGTTLRLSKLYLQEAQTVLQQNVASHNVCVT